MGRKYAEGNDGLVAQNSVFEDSSFYMALAIDPWFQ